MNIKNHIILIIYLLLKTSCPLCDGIESNFQYYIFENFEITRHVFNNELRLKENLSQFRRTKNLSIDSMITTTTQSLLLLKRDRNVRRKNVLNNTRTRFSIEWYYHNLYKKFLQFKNSFKKKKSKIKMFSGEISKIYSNYSNHDIFIGAANGFLILQEVYDINIEMTTKGVVAVPNEKKSINMVEGSSHKYFNAEDLMLMATVAFHNKRINNAVNFLEASSKILHYPSQESFDGNSVLNQTKVHVFSYLSSQILERKKNALVGTSEISSHDAGYGKTYLELKLLF